jgi:D-alanyl-D-alanine carboxypeptidase
VASSRARRARLTGAKVALSAALVVSLTTVSYRGATEPAGAVPAVPGPSLVEAVSDVPVDVSAVPTSLRTNPDRGVQRASRSLARQPVPGCDGTATGEGQNGRLPASELCDLWQRPYQDRADAVVTLWALNDAFRARFGTDMCLASGYRDLEAQAALRASKGAIAARAGQSNHGWGLAIDFCASTYTGEPGRWLDDVAPIYGWANPAWARPGGSGSFEPWHWEYASAVAAKDRGSGRG